MGRASGTAAAPPCGLKCRSSGRRGTGKGRRPKGTLARSPSAGVASGSPTSESDRPCTDKGNERLIGLVPVVVARRQCFESRGLGAVRARVAKRRSPSRIWRGESRPAWAPPRLRRRPAGDRRAPEGGGRGPRRPVTHKAVWAWRQSLEAPRRAYRKTASWPLISEGKEYGAQEIRATCVSSMSGLHWVWR